MNISKKQAFDIGCTFTWQMRLCHTSQDVIKKLRFSSYTPVFSMIADKLDPEEIFSITKAKAHTLMRELLMEGELETCVKCGAPAGRYTGPECP